MGKTITRYAPSPTGNPHVGNIRTALFNYLYAKNKGGDFFLRIEDTDQARFVPQSIQYIEESLRWLGIEYDGEKIFQSDRLPIYQEYAQKLMDKGLAYKCFCSPERLDQIRKEQVAMKLPPAYDKRCRNLSDEQVEQFEKNGEAFVIRFAIPGKGSAKWDDLIRGEIEIDYKTQDDFVMIKSDGWPTYHFANVIDDHEMKVTDVIRGEEWIPSTPKHIALYKALGWEHPNFAHIPLTLGTDKTKLSKRHGDTAVLDYAQKGYLPQAFVNFLALLGWNPGTEEEFFTIEELIKKFDIKRMQSAPAVFDIEKLNWINGNYIRRIDDEELAEIIKKDYKEELLTKACNFSKIVAVEKSRLVTLTDIFKDTEYYLNAPSYDPQILVFKKSTKEDTLRGLKASKDELSSVHGDLGPDEFADLLAKVVEKTELSNGAVFWPVRVALSGKEKSPSPGELLWVLGKEESLKRIEQAIDLLK